MSDDDEAARREWARQMDAIMQISGAPPIGAEDLAMRERWIKGEISADEIVEIILAQYKQRGGDDA